MARKDAERETVPVFFAGEKVGTATVDNSGTVSMIVNSPLLAGHFRLGTTEHLTLTTKSKEK